MARPNGVPNWTAALVLGLVVCAIVLMTVLCDYTLHLRSGIVELEMRPTSQTAAAHPP